MLNSYHYPSQMWLAETHYPVGDAFPAVIVPEVVLLLAVHPRDDFQITFLPDCQHVFCILIAPLNLTYLLQYLAEQVNQPACNLPRLAPAVLALFPVCQVRLLHVKELCPRTAKSQSAAQLAHRRIALLDLFPQQLRVSRITHLALIARRICVHRVQVLHVRSPLVGEYALELLYLQLPCKFQHYVVQQLVVRQWACRIYYHVAEYLVVDVAVQLFHQFRAAESSEHLQEHQGHFSFRSEERLASQLRPHAFSYQTEVLCHLAEREQLHYSAQFTLFES